MQITLKQLRAFDAVARTGSFTEAARALHLTQSALSVLVRELEGALGVRVLDRQTRRNHLTDAGRDFMPYVQRVLAELQDGVGSVTRLRENKRGRVRIAAPQMLACTLMPRAIGSFLAAFPGIEVKLVDTLPEQLLEILERGEVDLALGPGVPTPGIERSTLLDDAHWLVCPPDHPLARRKKVRWSDVRQLPFIAPTRDFMSDLRLELGHSAPSVVHEVSYMTTALGMVAAGQGVTACPTYSKPLVKAWDLQMLPLVEPLFVREVFAHRLARRSLSPPAEAFAGFMRTFVRQAM
ncbi:MAG: LysR family transcriptional regulator [Proteobacteria bacterium]|nr:LysR family transcriptional regulator [Pseudomonadota bacterium]